MPAELLCVGTQFRGEVLTRQAGIPVRPVRFAECDPGYPTRISFGGLLLCRPDPHQNYRSFS